MKKDVRKLVLNILSEQFDIDKERLSDDINIRSDLGADSLAIVDLMMTCEDEFEIKFSDTDIPQVLTIGALVDYIEQRI